MKDNTEEKPVSGGSYVRDPKTGELVRQTKAEPPKPATKVAQPTEQKE